MSVVLYTTHCPKCAVLSKKLDDAKVDYVVVDDASVMIDRGFQSAPILEVDGVALEFKAALDWVKDNQR